VPQVEYEVSITFDYVTNTLPLERGHGVPVTVVDENDDPVSNVLVSFSTNLGAFDYSGVDEPYREALTDQNGVAVSTVYANRPGWAELQAWIDLDGDDLRDAGEPYDTATKEWIASGPYVLASDYEVLPLDWIAVDIYDHDPVDAPYTLLWCSTAVTDGIPSALLLDGLYVGDAAPNWGDALDIDVQIPQDSDGYYRLETHTGSHVDGSHCGDPLTLVAHSADLLAIPALPDLVIDSFSVPDEVRPSTVFTMSVTVVNLTPGATDSIFDIDFYVDPDGEPPPGRIGVVKQWCSGLDAYGTTVITTVMWLETTGAHEVWARVDTTDYVEEENEDNNADMVVISPSCPLEEVNEQVVVPATAYSGRQSGQMGSRTKVWEESSYDGTATMLALADSGNNWSNYYSGGTPPLLRYDVEFDHPGVYYIWIRGRACNESSRGCYQGGGSNDSVWVSLNGPPSSNCYRLTGWGSGLGWESDRHSPPGGCPGSTGQPALVVPSAGSHQVQVRMREDGFEWATMVLTTTPGSAGRPYGDGPSLVCGGGDPPPWGTDVHPPGMVECSQLFEITSFEGNVTTVFQYWRAGGAGAFQRTGYLQHQGAFSMRLHASKSVYPCDDVQNTYTPWIFQTVRVPSDVFTMTTFTVEGWRAVAGTVGVPCSADYSPDADDVLYVQVLDDGGNPLSQPTTVTNGGVPVDQWSRFAFDFTDEIGLVGLADQDVRVRFYAEHDQDTDGTWFFIDDVACNVCTRWPVPERIPGMAIVGGLTQALVAGVPQPLVGVEVWAYSQGSQVYRTRSIHDGSYHFYNIPPGAYTIYAEAWVGGYLRTAVATVTLVSDDLKESIHLLLQ